jgi:hypothetical protein
VLHAGSSISDERCSPFDEERGGSAYDNTLTESLEACIRIHRVKSPIEIPLSLPTKIGNVRYIRDEFEGVGVFLRSGGRTLTRRVDRATAGSYTVSVNPFDWWLAPEP